MTDPISDFLTRIRNASSAGKAECRAQHSSMKAAIAAILKDEGYIRDFREENDSRGHKELVVALKYVEGSPVIAGIQRQSKPGRRLYYKADEVPRVLEGLGVGILTTSKGLMKDQEARRNRLGGEFVCSVW
jgi:small subunit ribosomal protein S8